MNGLGDPGPTARKQLLQRFFQVLNVFYSFTVVYQWFISGPTFPGWGVQMLISIDTHRISESGEPTLMPEPSLKPSENILHDECTCS